MAHGNCSSFSRKFEPLLILRMKTTIVTGLLGSGKTTFIRNHLLGTSEKTVVLMNDFGAAGIDGEIVSAHGIQSVELPSGCVCCTLKYDLITTITRIRKEFSPDHLMIEPSGIASPSGVLEALDSAGITFFSVVGIVDVTEFAELYQSGMYGRFFKDQIVHSDVILVNKTDLVKEEKSVEAERLIESVNPRAVLLRTVHARVFKHDLPPPSGERAGVGDDWQARHKILFTPSAHFNFETISFALNVGTGLDHFSDFFDDLAKGAFGGVVRAKALIHSDQGSQRFDAVYGKVDVVPFEQMVTDSRLVVIGERLNREAIEKRLFGMDSQ